MSIVFLLCDIQDGKTALDLAKERNKPNIIAFIEGLQIFVELQL